MSKKEKLHPVVDAYMNSCENMTATLGKHLESDDPVIRAMLSLNRSALGNVPIEEAIQEAEAVFEKSLDPSLAILFLYYWQIMSSRLRRFEEVSALYKRVKVYASEEIPPEIQVVIGHMEGLEASFEGNIQKREEILKEALDKLPSGSPRCLTSAWTYGAQLAQLGRLKEIEAELPKLEKLCNEDFPGWTIAQIRFVNLVEIGHAEEALALLSRIENEPQLFRHGLSRETTTSHKKFIDLMLDRWKPEKKESEHDLEEESEYLSTSYLLKEKPEEALHWARRFTAKEPGNHAYGDWAGFCLIRAELAAGNGEVARRLLELRRSDGNLNYLDDFFFARIEVLAGNREKAAGHFAAAVKNCEYYDAQPRLDFELSLALELSKSELMRVSRSSSLLPEKDFPPLAIKTASLPKSPTGIDRLVGCSSAVTEICETIQKVAPLDIPILITGETGTGKELVARAIHEEGPRNPEPFLAINCSAIAETLLQSELFGHEKGAFTGAARAHKGIFEEAGEGTVLLDEIGEVSPRLQAALLRVLETSEVRPVGSSTTRKFFCRVVTTTNAQLERLVEEGRFRQDLLYRLRRLEIKIPPLRERLDDIIPLAYHFFNEGRKEGVQAKISPDLEETFKNQPWPGNIRELRNTVERMRLLNSDKLSYHLSDLEPEKKTPPEPPKTSPATTTRPKAPSEEVSLDVSSPLENFEKIEKLLRKGKRPFRRLEILRELFKRFKNLTRLEIVRILKISPKTATGDLKTLCQEGFVEKVEPNSSPRSHYFVLLGRSSD